MFPHTQDGNCNVHQNTGTPPTLDMAHPQNPKLHISLPCTQELAVGPYPKPAEFSLHSHNVFFYDPFEYYPVIYT
jgi:hypothetical protein